MRVKTSDTDLVSSVFEHRLQDAELEKLLGSANGPLVEEGFLANGYFFGGEASGAIAAHVGRR